MTFFELAKSRYSVRSFTDALVPAETLGALLETARIAPTAHNNQPQRIKVITEPDDLARVDQCTPCRFGAGTVFLVCYDASVCWQRSFDGALSGEVDASIVVTHLMLAAQDLGLGSCWVMHFDPAKAAELFDLPETIVPVAFLPIGYPSWKAIPAPGHILRHKLDAMLF